MKIAVIGAGLGGCITAMQYDLLGQEVEIYHDPNVPIERVGQGTTCDVVSLMCGALNQNWSHNDIKATKKWGINYKNWGKKDVYHDFYFHSVSAHYVPNLLKEQCLKQYKSIEKNISDPEQEIDADYIFDCRGRPSNLDEYHKLTNPLNAVSLATGPYDPKLEHTEAIATPDGWTFVIPNHDSTSYGYLHRSEITPRAIAEKNFSKFFNAKPDGYLKFDNYIAKNIWRGERTILNGNMLSFLEPLEATSGHFYKFVAESTALHLINKFGTRQSINNMVHAQMRRIETFILWHYMGGSKYDTPFWRYAKSLPFKPYAEFAAILDQVKRSSYAENIRRQELYALWYPGSFDNWTQTQEV